MWSAGTVPTFIQSSPVYILETLDVGSRVMEFSFTDDIGDVITYTVSENSYFDYNISSGTHILDITNIFLMIISMVIFADLSDLGDMFPNVKCKSVLTCH